MGVSHLETITIAFDTLYVRMLFQFVSFLVKLKRWSVKSFTFQARSMSFEVSIIIFYRMNLEFYSSSGTIFFYAFVLNGYKIVHILSPFPLSWMVAALLDLSPCGHGLWGCSNIIL